MLVLLVLFLFSMTTNSNYSVPCLQDSCLGVGETCMIVFPTGLYTRTTIQHTFCSYQTLYLGYHSVNWDLAMNLSHSIG